MNLPLRFISYPSRRCPASVWLENRRASVASASPPAAASAQADAAKPPASSGAVPLLSDETLDLALLISCLPKAQHGWLMAALPHPSRLESRRYAPPRPVGKPAIHLQPQPHPPVSQPAGRPSPGSPLEGLRDRLGWLRTRLRDELAAGLSIAATPLWQMGRARRNQALVVRGETIGRLAEALGGCPGSEPLEQELERALGTGTVAGGTGGS